jgi:hypothetical protein
MLIKLNREENKNYNVVYQTNYSEFRQKFGSIMTLSADMKLGNEFRLLTELTFSYTEVHTCLVLTISAFRNLGRVILVLTELRLHKTGVPLGSIMRLSADMNLGQEI